LPVSEPVFNTEETSVTEAPAAQRWKKIPAKIYYFRPFKSREVLKWYRYRINCADTGFCIKKRGLIVMKIKALNHKLRASSNNPTTLYNIWNYEL
jgi:hypothetical protein